MFLVSFAAVDCKTVIFGRSPLPCFWTFSEGARRRKRDPPVGSAQASHPILRSRFYTRSRPFVRILTVARVHKTKRPFRSLLRPSFVMSHNAPPKETEMFHFPGFDDGPCQHPWAIVPTTERLSLKDFFMLPRFFFVPQPQKNACYECYTNCGRLDFSLMLSRPLAFTASPPKQKHLRASIAG